MPEDRAFHDLMSRVRTGEQRAAAELVRRYEPEIRRAVRVFLGDASLGRLLDSADICQSVFANFFPRVAAGKFDLQRPEDLLRLLLSMARNKLHDQARKLHAERRDSRRAAPASPVPLDQLADSADSPGRIVAGQELLQKLHAGLTSEERY